MSLAVPGSVLAGLSHLQPFLDKVTPYTPSLRTLGQILGSVVATIVLLYLYRYPYTEWRWARSHNLRGPRSDDLVVGNQRYMKALIHPRRVMQAWIDAFGATGKMHGLMGSQKIYTADPVAIQHIFQNPDMFPKSSSTRVLFGRALGDGVLTAEGEEHRRQRRVLNPAFSPRAIKELGPVFFEKALTLRDKMSRLVDDGESVPVGRLMEQISVDTVTSACFDHEFDILKSPTGRHEFLDAMHQAISGLFTASGVLSVLQHDFAILRILPTFGNELTTRSRATLDRISAGIVNDKVQGLSVIKKDTDLSTADIISRLIRACMADDIEPRARLSYDEVLAEISTIIFGSAESTTLALTCALRRLAVDPELQHRLRQEILSVSDESSLDELIALPFLEHFVREVLRMDGPVPILYRSAGVDTVLPLGRPIIGRDGGTLHSVKLEKGDDILLCMANVDRDPAIWGPDANEFNPDRYDRPQPYLESAPGVYGNILCFIGGPRNCVGWRFALADIKVVIATLLRAFEFEDADQLSNPVSLNDGRPMMRFVVKPVGEK